MELSCWWSSPGLYGNLAVYYFFLNRYGLCKRPMLSRVHVVNRLARVFDGLIASSRGDSFIELFPLRISQYSIILITCTLIGTIVNPVLDYLRNLFTISATSSFAGPTCSCWSTSRCECPPSIANGRWDQYGLWVQFVKNMYVFVWQMGIFPVECQKYLAMVIWHGGLYSLPSCSHCFISFWDILFVT